MSAGARLCHQAGGELEQVQFLLGHVSAQTMERSLGCRQRFRNAVNDRIGLEPGSGRSPLIPPCCATIQELSRRLHFLSVARYAVKVRPLLVDDIRFRRLNILPSSKGSGLLPSRLRPDLGGFLLLTPSFRVHSAGDPGVMRPWVYSTNLVFEMQELGFSFSRETFRTRRASLAAFSIPALKDRAFRAIWVNKPVCQHEKIGACVPLTTIIEV
jgi:hypothetical protein